MKPFHTVAAIAVFLIALCGGGYWLLIRRDLITALPSRVGDPSGRSGVQGVVRKVIEPVRELDLQVTHDPALREYLKGSWACDGKPYIHRFAWGGDDGSDGSADFVEISPDGSCRFSLHEFQHVGRVVYNRSYAGFFTEFRHGEKTYIFIFSPDDETWDKEPAKQLAVAFVGHDPEPRSREIDYQGKFTRMPNKSSHSNRH
jgi:hypothetical protein